MKPISIASTILTDYNNKKSQISKQKVQSGTSNTYSALSVASNQDRVEISASGMNKYNLKTESEKYVDSIRNTNLINNEIIQEIRQKIASDSYSNSEVVEIISENLLALENYAKA